MATIKSVQSSTSTKPRKTGKVSARKSANKPSGTLNLSAVPSVSAKLPQLTNLDLWVSTFSGTPRPAGEFLIDPKVDLISKNLSGAKAYPRSYMLSSGTFQAVSHTFNLGIISALWSDLPTFVDQASKVFADIKTFVENFADISTDIGELVKKAYQSDASDPDELLLILRYLLKGKCTDRLNQEIVKPSDDSSTFYFDIGLDMAKILLQRRLDKEFKLAWLAKSKDSLDDKEKAKVFWETNATKLSNQLTGAGVSGAMTLLPTLQDDAKKAASLIIGVTVAKKVEQVLDLSIDKDAPTWVKLWKDIEGDGK